MQKAVDGLVTVDFNVTAIFNSLAVAMSFRRDVMTVMDKFPQNRYTALEEAQKLLGFKEAEMRLLFSILRKAEDCILEFSFGDLSVRFELWQEDEKKITMSLELERERRVNSVTHEYSLKELEDFSQKRKLQIENLGEG
jgi:hypothetical protein